MGTPLFEKTFGFKNSNLFHSNYATYLESLTSDNTTTLKMANKVWIDKDYRIADSYQQKLTNIYKNEAQLVDFKQSNEAMKVINSWTNERTNGLISQIIPEKTLSINTKLLLTNALYLKALWLTEFPEENTTEDTFFTPEKKVTATFMKASKNCFYLNSTTFEVVIQLFKDKSYFTIVIPKDSYTLQDIEKQLTPAFYQSVLCMKLESLISEKMNFRSVTIDLFLPRFELSKTVNAKHILAQMGLTLPFDMGGYADFSEITGNASPLRIDDVLHNSYLKVTEKGVEGGSTTSVVFGERGGNDMTIKVNRPFLFFICDENSGSILFQGRVVNPNNTK